jgi:aminopeptidase N
MKFRIIVQLTNSYLKYMIKFKLFTGILLASAFFLGCKNTSKVPTVITEELFLDEVEVVAPKEDFVRPNYNPSYPRRNDLLHTILDVRFDWSKQHLLGKATLKLKPVFYDTDSLRLDAKGFDIQKIVLKNGNQEIELKYVYNDRKNIFIKLDRFYKRNEEYTIYIEYTAKPNELPIGGSAAITADKGLYFINPLKEDLEKPQQIWTQGETESSSCWFPTIDRPNERTTQEMYITVEDRFKTLSNGLLKSSQKNNDGTRTDYWVMDQPHAPYLFMMAVGEFAVVKDDWNGMLLEYYVEPKFEKDAKNIFPYTPEMLTFFSEKFGVKYPWKKYSQVVVRDYVSGAMENTTAVIFGEFVQNDSRSLSDNSDMNEGIVAHEMMHHWFGDLVTCESWSNLPLNESFANYSEYLWFEHKYSRDHADYIRMNEIRGYMNQASIQGDAQPLIRFEYADKEDMFDAHSYNKGGAILHMLRHYLGDAAYFEALRVYLEENKFKAAEVHDLRLAFEKVSGEDLNWFFNQWFLTKGHPKLEISRKYDAAAKKVIIDLEQTQIHSESTVFILPMAVDIYSKDASKPKRHQIRMTEQKQTFEFDAENEPLWVSVDAERVILCERTEEQTIDQWVNQYKFSKLFQDRYDALSELKSKQSANPNVKAIFMQALNDPFWVLRNAAIDEIKLDPVKDVDIIQKIENLALNDTRADVRAAAVERLGSFRDKKQLATFQNIFKNDKSYRVLNVTLLSIEKIDAKAARDIAKAAEKETNNATLLLAIAELYTKGADKTLSSFYENNYQKMTDYSGITFFDNYSDFLIEINDIEFIEQKLSFIQGVGTNQQLSQWLRYAAANALKKLEAKYKDKTLGPKISTSLKEVISKEKNPMLLEIYSNWN